MKLDKFGIVVQTANSSFQFPWQEDRFLMLVFMDWGHSQEALRQLNRVQLQLQIIFLSNVLTTSSLRIDPSVFWHRGPGTNHFTKNCPVEEPTEADFWIWKEALEDICPSRMQVRSGGEYIAKIHRIHPWCWCLDTNKLLHFGPNSKTIEVYSNMAKKLNQFMQTSTCQWIEKGKICLVDEIQLGVFQFTSTARKAPNAPLLESFLDRLRNWGCTWLWEHMLIKGGTQWIPGAIQEGSLVTVTDGSYIRQLYPNLCSPAFILECAKGRGKIIGSFAEELMGANAYRGKLLGLMAIRFLLVSIDKVHTSLSGSVEVVSNYL